MSMHLGNFVYPDGMDDAAREFAAWLNAELDAELITQTEFALMTGWSKSAVHSWTKAVRLPSDKALVDIANSLGKDLNLVRAQAGKRPLREYPSHISDRTYARESVFGQAGQFAVVHSIRIRMLHILGRVPADSARWTGDSLGEIPIEASEVNGMIGPAVVVVSGDCLIDRGIHDGDKLVIDQGEIPRPGDVVVVRLGDAFTCKEWWPDETSDRAVILRPAASGYSPIRVSLDDDDVELIGVVRLKIRVEHIGRRQG